MSSGNLGRKEFNRQLFAFNEKQGNPLYRHPIVGGYKLDFFLLYTLVRERGGFHKCAATPENRVRRWDRIVKLYREAHPIPPSYTALPYILRKRYKKYILQFEVHLDARRHQQAMGGGAVSGGGASGGGAGQSDCFRARKRKRTELENESCVVPHLKRRHLFRDDLQRDLVTKAECVFVAHVRDDELPLSNFDQVLWAVNAVFSLSTAETKSALMIRDQNGKEEPQRPPKEEVRFRVWLMDPLILTHDFPRIVDFYFDATTATATVSDRLERCALSCVSAIRNFVTLEDNAEFLSPSEDLMSFVLRGVLKTRRRSSASTSEKSEFRESLLSHFVRILVQLARSADLGQFSIEFQREFFRQTSVCLVELLHQSQSQSQHHQPIALEILESWALLQVRNQVLFEKFVEMGVWTVLVGLLSPHLSTPRHMMARSLVLDLFHAFLVESVVVSGRFKKALLRIPGFVGQLISVIECKSGMDPSRRRSRYDDYGDELLGKDPKVTRYPSDLLVFRAASVLKVCARLTRKVLLPGDLMRLRVCQACVRDVEVCTILYNIAEREQSME